MPFKIEKVLEWLYFLGIFVFVDCFAALAMTKLGNCNDDKSPE